MNKILRYTAVILFFLISNHLCAQSFYADLESDLQEKLDEIVKENKLPGITFSVVFDKEHQINLASGYDDTAKKTKLKPESRMLSGSVGKMFVSAIALKLQEEGKLQLDDKIKKYLGAKPWFSSLPNAGAISIIHLMNHTSGLPRYIFQPEFITDIKENPLKERTPEDCIAYVLNKPALHATASGWAYSDTNYLILGLIIEAVTGKSYYELLEHQILKPFELRLTSPSNSRSLKGLSQGYIGGQNYFGLPKMLKKDGLLVINPAFEWTGGGVVTNVNDLALFAKRLHEGDFLSEETKDKLRNAVSMATGAPSGQGYGLGSFVWSKSNDTRYGHSGFFPGYLSHVEYTANRQYAIAIQINTDEGHTGMQQYIYALDQVIRTYLDRIDEAKIRNNFKQQEACWNKGDTECYMKAYATTEPIQTISRAGVTYGYKNILDNYRRYFPKDKMGTLHFDRIKMKRLADNLYFVTGRFNLEFPDREDPAQGWFSVIAKKINGAWYMITDHSS